VSIFHNLGGGAVKGERLFNTEGGAKYFPSKHFGVSGGYRFARYKAFEDDNFITVKIHDPFFGGIFRF
jgi:hypothetical protein